MCGIGNHTAGECTVATETGEAGETAGANEEAVPGVETSPGDVAGPGKRLRAVGDVDRRQFLQLTGATAGASALVGSATGPVGAHIQCSEADQFVAADSSNYTNASRGAGDIDWIVVHVTVGSYAGAINWFQNEDADVSAHYVVSNYEHTDYPPGHVTQMVHHEDTAWHARGSNTPSIGIEHEWHPDYGRYLNDDCYEASARVVRCLAELFDVPLSYYTDRTCIYTEPGGILGHRDTPQNTDCTEWPSKSCPGPDWNGSRFMEFVEGCAGPDVSTDGATDVTDEAATLHGTLHDVGPCADEASISVQYRERGSTTWNTTDPRRVSAAQPFEERVVGLDSATEYEFRAVARDLADVFRAGTVDLFETYLACLSGTCV